MQITQVHALVLSREIGALGSMLMEHTGHCRQLLAYLKHRQENCATFGTPPMVCAPFRTV